MAQIEPRWSYQDVANYTGLPASTIRYLRMKSEGPRSYKLGRAVRFDPADVIAWCEAQREAGVGYAADEKESA